MTLADAPPAPPRPAPYAEASEAWVIGARLVTRYPRPDLEAEDFWVAEYRRLWVHLDSIPTGPDRALGDPVRKSDIPIHLRDTAEVCAAACAGNPAHHARIVRDHSRARTALAAAGELAEAARAVDLDRAYDIAQRVTAELSS